MLSSRSGNYTVFTEQALRIKPEFQGQGLNHTVLQFVFDYIKTEFQTDNCLILSTARPAWPSQFHGKQDDDCPDSLENMKKDSCWIMT